MLTDGMEQLCCEKAEMMAMNLACSPQAFYSSLPNGESQAPGVSHAAGGCQSTSRVIDLPHCLAYENLYTYPFIIARDRLSKMRDSLRATENVEDVGFVQALCLPGYVKWHQQTAWAFPLLAFPACHRD